MQNRANRLGRFIIPPEERITSEIPYHLDCAPGVRRVFLEKKMLPAADAYVMVRTARDVKADQPGYIDYHAHNVSSVYLFIGDGENLEGLEAEVMLGDEVYAIHSPATVFVPRGVPHCSRLTGGSGHFAHVVMRGDYRESLIDLTDSVSLSGIRWEVPESRPEDRPRKGAD